MTMQTVRDALQMIAAKARLPSLELDSAGVVELRVEDTLSLYITRISDWEMELGVALRDGGSALSDDELSAMLALVPSLLPSRLALDADGRPLLCRRIDVRLVDDALLEAHVLAVLRQAVALSEPDAFHATAASPSAPAARLDKLTFRP